MSASRIAAAAVAVALLVPVAAFAAQRWAWPVGSSVSLSYGATYAAPDGRRCTHGGIDVIAPAGATVSACAPGMVTFAGLVPAGVGRRAIAVTVATDDGLHVTYLPLERTAVHTGSRVAEGDPIGELAEAGDGSSAEPHLHLSVKRGSRELDPLSLLAGSATAPTPTARPVTPKGASGGDGPGLPVNASAPMSTRMPSAERPVASGAMSALPNAGPVATSELQSLRVTASASLRTMCALPAPRALPVASVPPGARLLSLAIATARARDGVAWVVLRLLLAAAAVLCLRPVLGALKTTPTAAETLSVRRART
jgi:hypothetical protein